MTRPAQRVQRAFIQVITIAVFVLGLLVVTSISGEFSGIGREGASSRGPASLAGIKDDGTLYDQKTEIDVVSLDCATNSYNINPVMQIQIKTGLCDSLLWEEVKETLIQNETNGSTAAVFRVGQSEVTTDFIQVNEGKNTFLIRHQLNDGRVNERRIDVTWAQSSK